MMAVIFADWICHALLLYLLVIISSCHIQLSICIVQDPSIQEVAKSAAPAVDCIHQTKLVYDKCTVNLDKLTLLTLNVGTVLRQCKSQVNLIRPSLNKFT